VNVSDSINSTSEGFNELDYWEGHLHRWQESGLSQKEYCARRGLNHKTFCNWKSRFKSLPSRKSSIKLVEVKSSFRLNGVGSSSSAGFGGIGSEGLSAPNGVGFVGAGSGIRFWCGEFCIEVGVPFSSPCLSQLIKTLQSLNQSGGAFCGGVEDESGKG
jgi:hypothetical protein